MKIWLIIKSFIIILFKVLLAKISKKKVIQFHHPNKDLTLNTEFYIKDLFSIFSKDYLIFYTHESKSLKKNNYHYITQWYLKFLIGVDFFLSAYVCDYFTINSTKIYIHHNIYDTPISDNLRKKKIVNKIIKYDYIFVSSNLTKKIFDDLFKNRSENNKPQTIVSGYLKLDYLTKKIKNNNNKKSHIIIAPANIKSYNGSYLINNLFKIIEKLISLKYKVVLRPHPSNIYDEKFNEIKKKFLNEDNFVLNYDKNYMSLYMKSNCLIIDTSGTAYTYAFLTERPVIFFEKYNKINNKVVSKSYFFKDRNKIGKISHSITSMVKTLKNFKNNPRKYKLMINSLKKNRLSNLGKSKNFIYEFINNQ